MVLAGAGVNGAQAAEDQRAWESQVAEYEDQIAASHAQAASAAEQVVAAHATALGELNATVTRGESLLTAGEHESTDHAVREALTTLRAALDEATSLAQHSEPGTITEELGAPAIEHHSRWIDNSRDAHTIEVAVSTDFSPTRLAEAAAAVESAATAVRSAQLEWARPLLADAIAAGEAALETSEGHVHDDDARHSLRASLTRARAIHDGVGYSADDVLAACDSVEMAVADEAAAHRAVADKTNQASASSGSGGSSASSVQDAPLALRLKWISTHGCAPSCRFPAGRALPPHDSATGALRAGDPHGVRGAVVANRIGKNRQLDSFRGRVHITTVALWTLAQIRASLGPCRPARSPEAHFQDHRDGPAELHDTGSTPQALTLLSPGPQLLEHQTAATPDVADKP